MIMSSEFAAQIAVFVIVTAVAILLMRWTYFLLRHMWWFCVGVLQHFQQDKAPQDPPPMVESVTPARYKYAFSTNCRIADAVTLDNGKYMNAMFASDRLGEVLEQVHTLEQGVRERCVADADSIYADTFGEVYAKAILSNSASKTKLTVEFDGPLVGKDTTVSVGPVVAVVSYCYYEEYILGVIVERPMDYYIDRQLTA